jgi:hypothetical protein
MKKILYIFNIIIAIMNCIIAAILCINHPHIIVMITVIFLNVTFVVVFIKLLTNLMTEK